MVVVGGTVGLVVLEYLLARYTVQFVTFQQSCNKMIKNVNQWLIRGVSGITEVDTWVYGVVNLILFIWQQDSNNCKIFYVLPKNISTSGVRVVVLNATFNNISVISCQFYWWRKTVIPGENHWPAASHWQTSSHNVISSTHHLSDIRTHNALTLWVRISLIGTDCIGSYKSTYHTVTTMTALF